MNDDLEGYIIFFAFLIFIVFGAFDIARMHRKTGHFKRGIKIGSGPLSPAMREFLMNLGENVVINNGFDVSIAWIFVSKDERLIWTNAGKAKWIDFVGYVNLNYPAPKLEYRASPVVLLLAAFFSLFIIFFPLFLLVFNNKKNALFTFLEQQTIADSSKAYES